MEHENGQAARGTAIDKALDILFHLHARAEAQGVSDIARSLRIPKSTAHRCLSSLRRREMVEQDDAGRYRPGLGLLELASGLLDRESLVAAAHPVLEEQAVESGETFFLVAARAGRLVVLDKAEGTGLLRVSPPIGSIVPVSPTAVGKLYLAHAPHLVGPSEPVRFTEHTIVDPERHTAEVEAARRRGYAVNDEEWIEGLGVVAAPILTEPDGMLGGVCTAMPSARLEERGVATVATKVIEAAERVAERMEGRVE